jgi:hypothetical protein
MTAILAHSFFDNFQKTQKLFKKNFVSQIAVGEDTNRGAPPWPVSPPAIFCDHKKFIKSFLKIFKRHRAILKIFLQSKCC